MAITITSSDGVTRGLHDGSALKPTAAAMAPALDSKLHEMFKRLNEVLPLCFLDRHGSRLTHVLTDRGELIVNGDAQDVALSLRNLVVLQSNKRATASHSRISCQPGQLSSNVISLDLFQEKFWLFSNDSYTANGGELYRDDAYTLDPAVGNVIEYKITSYDRDSTDTLPITNAIWVQLDLGPISTGMLELDRPLEWVREVLARHQKPTLMGTIRSC